MDNLPGLTTSAFPSLITLAINLSLSALLAGLVACFYTRYGTSLSNRVHLAQTLPVLALITTFVMSTIQSSPLLALGMMGALSIIRFRTAIKEQEELLYLFIALAIGVGMGAGQRWPTVLAILVILGYLFIRTLLTSGVVKNNLYLTISTPTSDSSFAEINQLVLKYAKSAGLYRLDHSVSTLQATYLITRPDEKTLTALMDDLSIQFPNGEFSFVEPDHTPGG